MGVKRRLTKAGLCLAFMLVAFLATGVDASCIQSRTTRRAVEVLVKTVRTLSQGERDAFFRRYECRIGSGSLEEAIERCSCDTGFVCESAEYLLKSGRLDRYGKLALNCHLG